MDRSLILKASALARGTRRIPLHVEDDEALALDDANVIDAEFVELVEPVALVPAAPVEPAVRVPPGRARRATDAYASQPVTPRPIIAIG